MLAYNIKKYIKTFINIFVLMLADFLILVLSFFIAYYIRGILYNRGLLSIANIPIENFYTYWYLLLIHIFFLFIFNIYSMRFSYWEEMKEIIKSIVIGTVFVFFILALLKISEQISRFIIIFIGVLSILIIPYVKIFIKYLLHRTGIWQVDTLIIAREDSEFDAYCNALHKNWYVGYRPGYIIKTDEDAGLINSKLIRENLRDIIIENNIVLPILYKLDKEVFYDIFIRLDVVFDNIKLVPDMHSLFVNNISVEENGKNLLINFNNNLLKLNNRVIQYLFNKIVSILLALLLVPVFVIIGILIRIDSRGPILYQARRIGYKDKDFYIYKFRTMINDADKKLDELLNSSSRIQEEFEDSYKIKNDPRVTRIGRFLRKTSLDELPQIFNVLKGEMNLVGPRPIVRDETKKYGEAFYELIKLKPGITGLWQISGRNDLEYEERVQLDLFYIKNWSLWMDIMILFKTISVVLKGKGAY